MAIDRTERQECEARRAIARRITAVVVLGVLIVASMYLYEFVTTSGRFSIAQVEVSGVSRIDSREIERLVGDLAGQNIILAPLDRYRARLAAHPGVRRASLSRILPDKVRCSIEEREPVALVFTDHFFEIDRDGMVMADDETTGILDLPIITGLPRDAVEKGRVSRHPGLTSALRALDLCKRIGGGFADEISELRVAPNGVWIESLERDCLLVLGDSDFENRLKKYFVLRETFGNNRAQGRVIDLRFDDQVVLRTRL